MASDRTKARIFSNTAWLTAGTIVNTLIGLYITRALARYLGVADYGLYTLAFVYLNFTAVIANFGFDPILLREAARDKEGTSALLTAGIVLKLLFAVPALAAGAAYLLARDFPPGYAAAVVCLLLTHFVSAFDTYEVVHRARLWGGTPAMASVLFQALTLGVVLWGRARGWPLEWLIASHLLVRAARAGFLYLRLRAQMAVHWRWDRGRALFILRESWVIGLTGILWVIYFRVDTLMLEWMKGPEAVGQYAAAYKFVELSLLGSGLLIASLGPLLAERWPANPAGFGRLFQQTVDYMGAAGALVAGTLLVFSADLIRFIFSPSFAEAVSMLRVLALAAPVIYLANTFGHVMVATGAQGSGFLTTRVTAALLNVLLNLWWIPRWGGHGAAWATVLSEAAVLLIAPWFIRRKTGELPRFWTPLLAAAAAGLAWLACRAAGGGAEAATWPGRLAGGGVLAAGLLLFFLARRRHLAELVQQLRSRRPAPIEAPPA
ncbi:MAG: flippase [Candidatus Tectomicrobia bacterium]|nr:flippase [Candidatus Tectomicrobia bacterium]